jgi:hypothetical protein
MALQRNLRWRNLQSRAAAEPNGRAGNCSISTLRERLPSRWRSLQKRAGRGIEGDRYFLGTGTYSSKPDFREVTVFEMEVLEALARNDPPLQSGPIKIGPNDHRRNLTVTGVPLNHLVGQRFRVGAAVLFGGRLNFPCKYLEKLLGLPVYLPLYNRSGLNCRIEKGGIVCCGDPVEPFYDR